jgi:hypothetical protein
MQSLGVHTRGPNPIVVAVALAVTLAACGSSNPSPAGSGSVTITAPAPTGSDPTPYPAPSDPMALAKKAGLVPEDAEQLQYHVHSHLDVFVDGKRIVVPAGLGIDITNPGVHTFTSDGVKSYGGIAVPCDKACISPLHTHDISGVLHTESPTQTDNTLGQLFIEWNVRLTSTCFANDCAPAEPVSIYVAGEKYAGDPTTIPLKDHEEIAVVVGTPPARIPNAFDLGLI